MSKTRKSWKKTAPPESAAEEAAAGAAADDAADAAGAAAAEAPDDATAKPEAPDDEAAGDDETARLEAELATVKDQLLRAMAETENVRRRAAKDREEAHKYAITGFARDLLAVVDNLRRALDSVPEGARGDEHVDALVAGVEMTERELSAVLERHGVVPIDAEGEKFDPERHQAMYEVETDDQAPGTVVEVMQRGYLIADRLLRPAMVAVAKAPARAVPAGDDAAPGEAAGDDA